MQVWLLCQQDVEQQQPGGLWNHCQLRRSMGEQGYRIYHMLAEVRRLCTIIVVVDRFSMYAHLHARLTKLCVAKEAVKLFFKNVLKYWGLARHIISD